MMLSLFVAVVLFSSIVQGNVFTVDLATLTTQRLDPVVFPDQSPEGHVHSIVGGSKFSKTSTYEELLSSQCSTGNIDKDLSAYWAPSLYVKKTNGKFHHVDMNFAVYYKLINDKGQTDFKNNPIIPGEFKSFPPGFKMLAGDITKTSGQHQINHKCYGPYTDTPGFPPNPSECTGGVRGEVTFPSCWDGETLETLDQSHVAYPRLDGGWEAGACPSTHPVRLPTLFYEAIYQTQDVGIEPGDELVYSFGDYSGFGFHGDFVMGWEDGVLDQLIDYCTYNEDGMDTQCNAKEIAGKHGGPNTSCQWEGTDDASPYIGELDELPPCGKACRP